MKRTASKIEQAERMIEIKRLKQLHRKHDGSHLTQNDKNWIGAFTAGLEYALGVINAAKPGAKISLKDFEEWQELEKEFED